MRDLSAFVPRIGSPAAADSPGGTDDPRDGQGGRSLAPAGGGVLACPLRPALSQPADRALWAFMHPHPDVGLEWGLVDARVEAEARLALPDLRARARSATRDEWHIFLRRCGVTTANAPTGVAFEAYVAEVHERAMRGTPVAALAECLPECQREEYFPKPAALSRIMGPAVKRALGELAAAEQLARGNVLAKRMAKEREDNPPPTEEQRAAVREKLRAAEALAERTARAERERLREAMAAKSWRQPTDQERAYAMRAELEGINKMLAASGGESNPGNARLVERRKEIWTRLTFLERKFYGERGFRDGENATDAGRGFGA